MKPIRLVALLLLTLLLGGSADFALPAPVLANSLFARVNFAPPRATVGTTQTLQVRLSGMAGRETIFRLNLTYPSGVTQEVTDVTLSQEATLEWLIPLDAGVGVAHFELYAIDCGCGDRTLSRPASSNLDKVTGEFSIELDSE
jgi:hypothetical protein